MRPHTRLLLLVLTALHLCSACSSSGSSATVDVQPQVDVSEEADSTVGDLASTPDLAAPVQYGPTFAVFAEPSEGPALYVTATPDDAPGQVTLVVRAKDLGAIAGLAFYMEYDPALMTLAESTLLLDLGSTGPYFTQGVANEIAPGVLTVGAARFCKDKIPWGTVDQCGGIDVTDTTVVAKLTFNLLAAGHSPVRFPQARAVVRRADRSLVPATWLGGTLFVVEEVAQ